MARFRKKPVEIEAWKVNSREPTPEWLQAALAHGTVQPSPYIQDALKVETLEGVMLARPGDWLIQGVAGELYPCKPEIFAATYDPVQDEIAYERGFGPGDGDSHVIEPTNG